MSTKTPGSEISLPEVEERLDRLSRENPLRYSILISNSDEILSGAEKCVEEGIYEVLADDISSRNEDGDIQNIVIGRGMMGLVEMGYVDVDESNSYRNRYDLSGLDRSDLDSLKSVLKDRDMKKEFPRVGFNSDMAQESERIEHLLNYAEELLQSGDFEAEDITSLDFETKIAAKATDMFEYESSFTPLSDTGTVRERLKDRYKLYDKGFRPDFE
ncbi:MAG: hypothetical protein ABEJ72_04395 [Candidatus Aenigmatarchaeota archaeon]